MKVSNSLLYVFRLLAVALALATVARATDIPVHAGDDLQAKIDGSSCGDTLTLDVRATGTVTWDGNFFLRNHGCGAGNPTTIRSANHASLPAGRVGPGDIANMAEIRATGTGGTSGSAIEMSPGAAYWIVDGIYFSDNAGTLLVNFAIDNRDATASHLTVTHSYIVQKENGSGAPYHRSLERAAQYENDSFTFKWNYIDNLIGYDYNGILMNTQALLCVSGCSNADIEDNYIGYWYSGLFLGGGDSAPTQTATLTGATLSSATFSNTTGITANSTVIRFGVRFVGVLIPGCGSDQCVGSITYVSGTALTSADVFNSSDMTSATIIAGAEPYDGGNGLQVTAVSGGTYTTKWVGGGTHPIAGTYTFTMYQTATVTSVVSTTVNYTPDPAMHDVLLHTGAAVAAWRPVADYLPANVTVKTNTFHTDSTFGAYVQTNNSSCPKGAFEIKNITNLLFEGNTHIGYPGTEGYTSNNQNGTAPWSTVRDVTMRSNWYNWDTGTVCNGQAYIVADNAYLHTTSPMVNFEFSNNLFSPAVFGVLMDAQFNTTIGTKGNLSLFHNTHLSAIVMGGSYNSAFAALTDVPSFTYRDNITNFLGNGMQCFVSPFSLATCFPSGVFSNNVPIDSQAVGFGTNVWGTGSVLSPIETAFTSVGFTNYAGGDYSLAMSSPFKGAGTSGSDPGVDWTTLQAALNGTPTAPTITECPTSPGTQGVAYTFTLTASGTAPFTWSIASGSVPTGLSLSGAVISGTPSGNGTSTFGIGVTNSVGSGTNSPLSCSLTITPVGGGGGSSIFGNVTVSGNVARN